VKGGDENVKEAKEKTVEENRHIQKRGWSGRVLVGWEKLSSSHTGRTYRL
jgi:hypothetical protein